MFQKANVRRFWLKWWLPIGIGAAVALAACGGSPPAAPTDTQAPSSMAASSATPAPSSTPAPTDTPEPTATHSQPAVTPESADEIFSAYGNLILLQGTVEIMTQMARQVEAGAISPADAQEKMQFLQSQLLPALDAALQAPAPAEAMERAYAAAREVLPVVRDAVAQAAAGDTTPADAAATLAPVRAQLAESLTALETYLAEDLGLDTEGQRLGREFMLAQLRAALGLPAAPEATATP
jgi:hypothetical protein